MFFEQYDPFISRSDDHTSVPSMQHKTDQASFMIEFIHALYGDTFPVVEA